MPTITVDLKEIDRLSAEFIAFPRECRVAMADAMNRAISKGKTGIAKEVMKEYAVKTQKAVKSTLSVKKASSNNLSGEIKSEGKRVRAADFPNKAQTWRGKPLEVNIKKSNGFRPSTQKPKMFTPYKAGTRRAGKGIYRHENGSREFSTVFTLSVPQMIKNDKVYEGIGNIIEETYEDRLYNHALPAMIRRAQERISG